MITQEYKEIDGVKIFHSDQDESHEDYNSKGLDNLYKQEEKHFWFIARKEFILQNVQKYIEKLIEIGNVAKKYLCRRDALKAMV